ncbi:MAG: TerB family tellurite resistance protein [Deltaproteobacteria bacterium]|jgi:uncharacterized tellurite resistance protein B-like protein|nr:TerB family tellurite resistance protein [Deltaproteobacteria bacterium]MBW2530586.1 TerB family tellurite resistance protein [Deltaproteobacteria bacterium]
MDDQTSRRVISLIAGVICSDEKMSPEERSFLLRVAEKLGLPRDLALMPVTDKEEVAAELGRLPEATRWETLDLLIQAAAADGQVVPEERELIGVVVAQLGLKESDVEKRLQNALQGS